jgi:outer membrane autotransporter protein
MKQMFGIGFGIGGVVLLSEVLTPAAMAACSNTAPSSGTTVTCSGTSPAVIAQTGSTGVAINVDSTAIGNFVHATNAVAFSVDIASTITSSGKLSLTGGGGTGTARGAALLGTGNNNHLTNGAAGIINTTGTFNDGMAANGSGNTLTNNGSITTSGPNAYGITAAWGQTNVGQLNNTLINTGTVSTAGSNARAASILGGSGTIDNSGTLATTGAASPTAYLQGNNDHLINTGSITAGGTGSDAVFSNTAGSSFTALIENRAGGQIISQNAAGIRTLNGNSTIVNAGLVQSGLGTAITMGNGNDSLILQTGSVINGSADGGAGTNTVTLQGAGTASNAFTNFQTLLMQGSLWNWTGSGTFTLAHVQAGTLNLTGTLRVSAVGAVDAGATLQANAGNLPQNVTDNGFVRFAQDNAGTYTGLISGTGAVEKIGAGTLTLAPAAMSGNSYSGGTTLTQGTIAVGADNALGASTGGITFNGGTLQLDRSFDLAGTRAIALNTGGGTIDTQGFTSTLSQGVTGAGAFTKAGSGTLTLAGESTYSGGTTISAGTMQLGAGGVAGSIVGDVTDNGALVFNRADSITFPGTISGNGSVTQAGSGTTVLTAGNSYGGGTTISAGTLQLGAGGATGSIIGDVTDNGALVFNRSDSVIFPGTISGTGSVTQAGGGTTVLTAGNSYGGGTTIAAGTLQLGNGGSSGSIVGDVTDNGRLAFNRSDISTFGGTVSGTGSVTQAGSGITVFGADNTYTGGTTIATGTLQLGNGGTSGGVVGDVTNNGALVFNRSDSVIFPGTISGTGSVTQAGSGTTILTGGNPYSGGTLVAAGTLALGDATHADAALSGGGPTTVASGATLGGYGSVTGNVTNNGTIAVANALQQFGGQANGSFTINGQLVNAGLVQIGGGQTTGNALTVNSYAGRNGTLGLNTVLGGDGSASDKLVINGGTATGTSSLKIANVGGPGMATLSNGIQVIQSINGATSPTTAFTLAAPAKAGAYEYYLAKGGVTDGTADNWYLRNTVAPQQAAVVTPPGSPPPPVQNMPVAAIGTPSLPAPPAAGSNPVPLYRPEVPVYAEIPTVARQLGIMQVDTFHDRQGEQSLLSESGPLPAAWGRVWGGHSVLSQSGDVNPELDGSVVGVQAGHDIYADTSASGHRNHYGFFIGFARATGDVSGFALGTPNFDAGHLAINAYSLGGYWTHIGPGGWYTDAVLMGSSLVVDPSSHDGINTTTHGNAVTSSLEGGLPIPLGYDLTLEPQAQMIWQHLSINDLNDGISNVTFNSGNTFLGRVGVRLAGKYDGLGTTWQPYLRLNVLRSFGSDDKATFGAVTSIGTSIGQTAGQIGAGVVAKLTKQGNAFATVSYVTNLGGEHQRTVTGNAGVRWAW